MPRLSRGCERCRQRKVRCDLARPACYRCVARGETCSGYRDEGDLIFRDETSKTKERLGLGDMVDEELSSSGSSAEVSSATPGSSLPDRSLASSLTSNGEASPSESFTGRDDPDNQVSTAEYVVEALLQRNVVYPCRLASTPSFTEHLPVVFDPVNVASRVALRTALVAASLADAAKSTPALTVKALEMYGLALSSLAASLAQPGREPDNADLMTVVVLDVLETLYLPDLSASAKGSHAQGMAHILRLKGDVGWTDAKTWSLTRVAHHRWQKQQLATELKIQTDEAYDTKCVSRPPGVAGGDELASDIARTCERARSLMKRLRDNEQSTSAPEILAMIQEIQELDRVSVTWRSRPPFAYTSLDRAQIVGDISNFRATTPDILELHTDVWAAYEWNYHRTSRIIMHTRFLGLLERASAHEGFASAPEAAMLVPLEQESIAVINSLAGKVLATVPQMLGDIDHTGTVTTGTANLRAVGAYLILWPVKILGSPSARVSDEQRQMAAMAYERVREYTGMRSQLGKLSDISNFEF
jgi:hypothetical protein